MDISVFYLNRKRFWGWILIPLVLRLLITSVFSYTTRSAVEELDHYKIYKAGVDVMEQSLSLGSEIFAPYESDEITPFRGWFLSVISKNSRLAGVETETSSNFEEIKGSKLQRNTFTISGSAASLHDLSMFVDMMMLEPKALITSMSFSTKSKRSENKGKGEQSEVEFITFQITFERVELVVEAGV